YCFSPRSLAHSKQVYPRGHRGMGTRDECALRDRDSVQAIPISDRWGQDGEGMMAKLEGLPIIDATRPLSLKVEPSDINRRARKSPSHCALAECASRMYKTEARVYMTRAYLKSAD